MKRWHRNLYHLVLGLFFPFSYNFASSKVLPAIVTGFLLILILIFEIERFKHPNFNEWVFRNVRGLVKEDERKKPTGTTFFLMSVLATILIFPKYIAVSSLTFLAVGDVSAAVVGERWGRIKLFGKSFEGFITFFIVSFLSGIFLLHLPNYPKLNFHLILLGSLAASIVEILPLKVDDNFSIPLITSFVMWLIK